LRFARWIPACAGMTKRLLCFPRQSKEHAMGKCAQCGNNYDQSFEVTMGGRKHEGVKGLVDRD